MGSYSEQWIKVLKRHICELAVTIELHQCDLCELYDKLWELAVKELNSSSTSVDETRLKEFFDIKGSILEQTEKIEKLTEKRHHYKNKLNFQEEVVALHHTMLQNPLYHSNLQTTVQENVN